MCLLYIYEQIKMRNKKKNEIKKIETKKKYIFFKMICFF